MDDLISRQAALDAIHCDITITGRKNAEIVCEAIASFVDNIKAMPAAQPKIVHCKDCKWWDKQDFLQGRCALLGIRPTGGWFCANADMKGENE